METHKCTKLLKLFIRDEINIQRDEEVDQSVELRRNRALELHHATGVVNYLIILGVFGCINSSLLMPNSYHVIVIKLLMWHFN